jgi:hypothetical protein
MAGINKLQPGVTSIGGTHEAVQFLNIHTGQASSFACLVIDQVNSSGVVTSWYYWPNTSGVLRYGSTAPTVSTQDSAGSAV